MYQKIEPVQERNLVRIFIFLLSLIYIHAIFYSRASLYSSYTDDFYYYLKIAKNLYAGKGMSFTDGVLTNGYQPLFQFLVIGLYYIARLLTVEPLIFIRLVFGGFFYASSVFIYKRLKPQGIVSVLLFGIGVIGFFTFTYNGMESLLIIPFLFLVLLRMIKGTLNKYLIGAAISICFFARIDSIIIITPIAFFYILQQGGLRAGDRWKTIISVGLGLLPIPLYMLVNYYVHGVYFPISGIAKSVTHMQGLNAATFQSFLRFEWHEKLLVLVTLAISVYFIFWKRNRYYIFLLATILLFYIQNALRSDWSIWDWYLYPFPVLLFLASYFFAGEPTYLQQTKVRVPALVLALVGVLLLAKTFFYLKPFEHSMVRAADRIQAFENTHKGNYAMGDRAGIVGYLLEPKLVQLEGLVMDKDYLHQLATTPRLQALLASYQVDYYISTNPVRLNDSTFIVKEPRQTRGASPHITDTIRWKVMDQFVVTSNDNTSNRAETIIFKTP